MNLAPSIRVKQFASAFALLLFLLAGTSAQVPTGALRGQVTDPSGAAVAGAAVVVLPPGGPSRTGNTKRDGGFEVKPLAPGEYNVQVGWQRLAQFQGKENAVSAGSPVGFNI